MRFPKEYFNGEEREGFYVEPMMKRAWASQIEILSEIDSVCKKHGIRYMAFWGSLLGAVRHAGFVPWDDDLDIIMLREDYDKFFEVASSELPEDYKVLSVYTEPEWQVGVGRVTNGNGIILMPDKLTKYHGCPYSMGIDIFPYDYVPDDIDALNERNSIIEFIEKTLVLIQNNTEVESDDGIPGHFDDEINERLNELETTFGFTFNREVHLINQLCCLYDQIYVMYGDKSSTYVTCYEEDKKRKRNGGREFKFPANWIKESIKLPFECGDIYVPKYYEACLSYCYGKSFMIPIKSGISGHAYPIYKDQIAFMSEKGLDQLYERSLKVCFEDYSDKEYIEPLIIFESGKLENSNIDKYIDCFDDKKTLLYCVSSADVYGQEEKLVKKVKDTLSFLINERDKINFALSFDPLIIKMFEWKSKDLAKEFLDIIDICIASNELIIDYSDVPSLVYKFDAFYGSPGEHMKRFMLKDKPVMVQGLDIIYE